METKIKTSIEKFEDIIAVIGCLGFMAGFTYCVWVLL